MALRAKPLAHVDLIQYDKLRSAETELADLGGQPQEDDGGGDGPGVAGTTVGTAAAATAPPTAVTSLTYCFAFLGIGLALSSLGPALLAIAKRTESTLDQCAWVFTGRAVGYLVGAIVGGLLVDRSTRPNMLLGGAMLLAGGATIAAPFATMLPVLGLLIATQVQPQLERAFFFSLHGSKGCSVVLSKRATLERSPRVCIYLRVCR